MKKATVILALGATENHGPHLPFGADTIFTDVLAREVAKRVKDVILLPPIWYGESLDHVRFPMTITLSPQTLENTIFEVLDSVASHGVKRVLLINGHDGNRSPIASAVKRLREKHPETAVANYEWPLSVYDHLEKGFFEKWGGHGHAGESETSIFLHIRPDLVETGNIPKDSPPLDYHDGVLYWSIRDITETGVEGAPRFATAEKGSVIVQKCVDLIVDLLGQLEERDWKPRRSEGKSPRSSRTPRP
jgi:creatinine amidohydrolase